MTVTRPQPIKVSYQYLSWIQGTNRGIMGHLYSFNSQSGVSDYFTDLDCDIAYNGIGWKSGSLRIEGLKRKLGIGTSIDEQSVKIWASPTDTLFGSNFLEGAQQCLLDGATLFRYRIIWPFVTGNASVDVSKVPIGCFPLFSGYISSIDKGGASHIEVKVKSALQRLNVNMPRNYFQPGCLWTLFSSGCTLNQSSYMNQTTISAFGGNNNVISPNGGVVNPTGGDGLPSYAQGRLYFASGANEGLLTLIDNNDATHLFLAYPLAQAPAVGDVIQYYPGCSKSFNTCKNKFGNSANFRGFDKVPPIMVSI